MEHDTLYPLASMENHKDRVAELAKTIRRFHQSSIPFRIYHGNTNSTRPSSRTHANTVDISGFSHVIAVNQVTKTCLVEPNVPMDTLVAAVLKYNLIPPVIPEFPGITVGGAFAGTAGESSSFRHGFFEDSVGWVEVVLANGDTVIASDQENVELFQGSKGTFGTLGVGTLFEVRLSEAKKFVQLQYGIVSKGVSEAKALMGSYCAKSDAEVQFVDGIMFSRDTGVVIVGKMTDQPDAHEMDNENQDFPVLTFSKASDPWFYLHVQHIMQTYLRATAETKSTKPPKELVPLQEYLFRYDRGAFWTGRDAFKYFITPFNWVTRWALDYFMHTRTMYHALHRSGLMQHFLVQDMAVPWHNTELFFEWLDKELNIYPLWLAPLKLGKGGIRFNPDYEDSSKPLSGQDRIVMNIGVWGFSPIDSLKANRNLEAKLMELRGMKWLYSQTFYTEDEFWSIYDRKWYDRLRKIYYAQTLPDVYEKVGGTALNKHNALTGIWRIWPLAGVYGVLSTLKEGDYLRKR